jgi:diketogulonate reductase-like aldo/keto reductase
MMLLVATLLAVASAQTHEIAPGVIMPTVNLGGVESKPSNYSAFLAMGGVGLDTALTYGVPTQTSVGAAIKASGLPRSKVFVTTKIPCCPQPIVGSMCANYSGSKVPAEIQADLDQLGVPEVDLMLLHWPCDTMEETVAAYKYMEDMVTQKKARAIGVSNFNASQLSDLMKQTNVKPAINQCGFSIGIPDRSELGRDAATRKYCKDNSIFYEAYSPLGGLSKINVLGDKDVVAIAAKHGVSAAQVIDFPQVSEYTRVSRAVK